MKRIFYLIASLLLLNACSDTKPAVETNTTVIAEEAALQKVIAKFKTNTTFPFVVDTAFLNKVINYDSLGTNEVKEIAIKNFTNGQEADIDYDIKEFYKIDSIKASGTYTAWCEKLDIGQTKRSNIYAIQKTDLDSNTTLLFWAHTTSSYEACPYFTTQTLNFTIVYKGAVSATYFLGEYSSYGDPPVSSEIIANGKMNSDGTFIIDWHQIGDEDMDQPFIFITDIHYEFAIKDGQIAQTKIIKSENKKTPRPKEMEY